MSDASFEPRVMLFSCNWCFPTSPGSESRLPPGSKSLKTLCTGRIHPSFVMRAFESGADGVLVAVCDEGNCHYKNGNDTFLKTAKRLEDFLRLMGIPAQRFRVELLPPGQSAKVLKALEEYREELVELGPLEELSGVDLPSEVSA